MSAGALLVIVGPFFDAIGEEGDAGTPGTVIGLGIGALAAGVVTLFRAEARYAALGILAALFFLAYSGELADDVLYEGIAGVAFVLIGLLSLIGHRGGRGRRGVPRASGADAASRDAPSGEPSTPAEEPGGRAPPS
jgi:hypothetical protein